MQDFKLFIDTHDKANKTFPENISREKFAAFFMAYESACREEGVFIVKTHVGYDDGRAFCLTLAPDADAVRRAHQRVGLPFDSITAVETASPGDTFRHLATSAGVAA